MKKSAALLLFIITILNGYPSVAQDNSAEDSTIVEILTPTKKHFYVSSNLDWGIFSTATMQRPGMTNSLGVLRFTYFVNTGLVVNYDWKHIGVFSGLDIKNIGFIEKAGDLTIKHRTYNIGIPLGLKLGNVTVKAYGLVGAGLDMPFNYREKAFYRRGNKEKFDEWFSDRTPLLMPYVFAGIALRPALTIKLQYYLNNYLNPDFSGKGYSVSTAGYIFNGPIPQIKPYAGYNVHLVLLTFGFSVPYSKGTTISTMKKMEAI